MGARSDLRRVFSRRLVPLFRDIEELIHRYGLVRTLTEVLSVIAVLGVLGTVLGITWLRVVAATVAALILVLVLAVSMTSLAAMRVQIRRNEALIHRYADALRTQSPLTIKACREEISIEPNGDARVLRELTLNAVDGLEPHYLDASLVYYGSSTLTHRAKRLVAYQAWQATAAEKAARIRANATATWTTAANGCPKLEVLVHLGEKIHQDDLIVVQWDWPAFSADLMRGRSPESFDTKFLMEIETFESAVKFRGTANSRCFVIRDDGADNLVKSVDGDDTIVRFSRTTPELGRSMGFTADFSD